MQCVSRVHMSSAVLCGWIQLLMYKYKVVVVLGVMVVPTTSPPVFFERPKEFKGSMDRWKETVTGDNGRREVTETAGGAERKRAER